MNGHYTFHVAKPFQTQQISKNGTNPRHLETNTNQRHTPHTFFFAGDIVAFLSPIGGTEGGGGGGGVYQNHARPREPHLSGSSHERLYALG